MDLEVGHTVWHVDLDESLGEGSFGKVYPATSGDQEAAVKLVPKDRGARRELLLADDLGGVPNVIPFLGVADAQSSWAIVMRRAETNLWKFLQLSGGVLDQDLALPILLDIAHALVGLKKNGVVHRDLKPANILLLEDHWCLADFGIGRYAEAATAPDTHKGSKTPAYAAPEQWRGERATPATDVYAFGVIAYELLTGRLPFEGPDLREQHLHQDAPRLAESIRTPLRSIVDECLMKAPQARPQPERLLKRLEAQADEAAPAGGIPALVQAHHNEVQRQSEAARRESAAQTERERRSELLGAAQQTFLHIEDRLGSTIRANAPSANEGSWPIRVGHGLLHLDSPRASDRFDWAPFDVIAYTTIKVDQSNAPGGTYVGRSHSLWYCDAQSEGEYGWFETSFMQSPLLSRRGGFAATGRCDPYAVDPGGQDAIQALTPGMSTHQVAYPFTHLVDDDLDAFVTRWAQWLGLAADGALQYPPHLPEPGVEGSWRR